MGLAFAPFASGPEESLSFFLEAQGVANWNLTHNSIDLFSYNNHHPMQKPGIE